MNFECNVEEVSQIKRTLKIEIEKAEYTKKENSVLNKLKNDVQIKGFRKGKVPAQMVKKMYGELVQEQICRDIIEAILEKALEQSDAKPINVPTLMDYGHEKGDKYEFVLMYEERPEIDPVDYDSLDVESNEVKIEDKQVDETIENILKSRASFEEIEGRSETVENDHVEIDYESTHEGENIPGLTGKNQFLLIGSNTFPGDFEQQLVGKKLGEEFEIEVEIPEDFKAMNLGGKTINSKVTVNKIKKQVLPKLDEKMIKELNPECTTEEDLRKEIKENMILQAEDNEKNRLKTEIFKLILEKNSFETPDTMIDSEIDRMIETYKMQMMRGGIDIEKMYGDLSPLRQNFQPEAKKSVDIMLITDAIAKKENFELSDEEFDAKLNEIAEAQGTDLEKLKKQLGEEPGRLDNYRQFVYLEKAENQIVEMNTKQG